MRLPAPTPTPPSVLFELAMTTPTPLAKGVAPAAVCGEAFGPGRLGADAFARDPFAVPAAEVAAVGVPGVEVARPNRRATHCVVRAADAHSIQVGQGLGPRRVGADVVALDQV